MASISDFFTREDANEGIKLPLLRQDGSDSGLWVRIGSIDSDAYRAARRDMERAAFRRGEGDDIDTILSTHKERMIAALILDWSPEFDDRPTTENKLKFVREAPHIADRIDVAATNRAEFSKKKLSNYSEPSSQTLG